nr:MAG TPA: hypothetical protein [Caudoviricetes sp.]
MLIDVHKMLTNKQRINASKCSVNKIYILVLDKISSILYYVARKTVRQRAFIFTV